MYDKHKYYRRQEANLLFIPCGLQLPYQFYEFLFNVFCFALINCLGRFSVFHNCSHNFLRHCHLYPFLGVIFSNGYQNSKLVISELLENLLQSSEINENNIVYPFEFINALTFPLGFSEVMDSLFQPTWL